MNRSNKENWIKGYEAGQTRECPFCGGENLEHSCRNCYSEADKEDCWKYQGYCQKCFVYIHEEVPKNNVLKKKLGVKCTCNEPTCAKCLGVNCKDSNCPVHTMSMKKSYHKRWEDSHGEAFPENTPENN